MASSRNHKVKVAENKHIQCIIKNVLEKLQGYRIIWAGYLYNYIICEPIRLNYRLISLNMQ